MTARDARPDFPRPALLASLLAAWLIAGPVPHARAVPAGDAERLVFLLEYIGTDYAGAVRDGTVVSASEYGEVLRFAQQLLREYGAPHGPSDAVADGLRDLEQRIAQRAPADEVWSATRRLLPALSHALGDTVRPATAPNLGNGRRLWASDCAPCHGPIGAGDGPSAGDMDPPPTAFRGERLERTSPRQIYSALTFGIADTAMPSFSLAYGAQQRWDVAFFVPTLRVDFDPKRPTGGPPLALDELAASSNAELLARLRESQADAGPAEVDWLRANPPPPAGATAVAADAAAAGGLAVALQLEDVFGGVAERVLPRVVGVSGYVRDPGWSPEQLRVERGDGWVAAHADALRYPGFRQAQTGSGFLVDDDGYVLSCDHLVRDEHGEIVPFVDVELQDQSHLATRVVGTEPTLDLAVLRVAEPAATTAAGSALEFADSDRIQVGHWLIAVGDPPGPEKTFVVGVVSAPPERQCYQEQLSATGIQSALVVPPRGLGGPVADISGRIVGISVRPNATTADAAPATHILPVNLVLNLYEALKVAQSHRSPWLGISVLELPSLRKRPEARGLVIPQTGVYVDDVFDPSPASRAGVRPGDFLLALGGHRLLSVGDFQTWLYVLGIGTTVQLEVQRDGRPLQVSAPIEVRPASAITR